MKRIALVSVFLIVLLYPTSVFSQDYKNRRDSVVIEEQAKPEMHVVNGTFYMRNAPIGKRVEIFTIIGNKIREIYIVSPEFDCELNLPRAIYLLRLDEIVNKVVIK